jgi:hypothetical protein
LALLAAPSCRIAFRVSLGKAAYRAHHLPWSPAGSPLSRRAFLRAALLGAGTFGLSNLLRRRIEAAQAELAARW